VHEYLVEQPQARGQGQAAELRLKQQGGMVWMALALLVQTRRGLGGAVREQRDMPRSRRLSERVRRWAACPPLVICPEGLVSYSRAMRETWRAPVHTGGRPRRRPWRHGRSAQVVQRYERRRVVNTERRRVEGTWARVETRRRRLQGDGVSNTAYLERRTATGRERLVPLARRCRTLARQPLTL
jgi:hypothetical protein